MRILLKLASVVVFMALVALGAQQVLQARKARAEAAGAQGGQGQRGGGGAALGVDVVVLRPERISWTARAVGTIEAREVVPIASEQSRRLVSIHVEEGQDVAAGDLLFSLEDTDLQARLRELQAVRQRLSLQEQRLATLAQGDAVSQSEYDDARLATEEADARIASVVFEIDRTRIRAPFAGRIGRRTVSPGAWVTPSQALATLYDDSLIKIDFRLPERNFGAINAGDSFRFRRNTYSPWKEATVEMIEPAIDLSTRSLAIRGVANNSEHVFLPGSFVEIQVPLSQSAEALMVPSEAVNPTADGAQVYVVEGGMARLHNVVLGERTADRVEVVEGLAEGDQLIVSNLLRIRPGATVQVVSTREGNEASRAAGAPTSSAEVVPSIPAPTPAPRG